MYHVVLEQGRTLGPFDRRTIVGMRIKKTLTSKHVLIDGGGARLTVGELVRGAPPDEPSVEDPAAGGPASSYSVIQGMHAGKLLEVQGGGYDVPAFKGEVEVRVQTKALRLAGRYRDGLAWKEERVKFPLQDIAHARLRGSIVDLWVRNSQVGEGLQRVTLDMLTPAAAGEVTEKLTHSAPWPGSEPLAGRGEAGPSVLHPLLWGAVVGTAVLVAIVLAWVLMRRF